jgi:hypothetical protein
VEDLGMPLGIARGWVVWGYCLVNLLHTTRPLISRRENKWRLPVICNKVAHHGIAILFDSFQHVPDAGVLLVDRAPSTARKTMYKFTLHHTEDKIPNQENSAHC